MASTPPLLHLQSRPSGAMSSTRYIALSVALCLSFWVWRQPFQSQFQSAPQLPSAFIPAKLYEPGAVACTDNLADEPEPISLWVPLPLTPHIFTDLSPAIPKLQSSLPSKNPPKVFPPTFIFLTLSTIAVHGGRNGEGSMSRVWGQEVWR